MAITRARKEELVAEYSARLEQTNGFIIAEYGGLSVVQTEGLRGKLYDASGEYVVTKNTLFKIALQQTEWPVPEDLLLGPVGIAFGNDNMPGVSKVMLDFAKEFPELFKIKGGVMAGEVITAEQVKAVSELPTLDELRAQIAGLLVQPSTGLVTVLDAATAQVARVINAYVQENSDGGEEAA